MGEATGTSTSKRRKGNATSTDLTKKRKSAPEEGEKGDFGKIMKSHAPEQQTRLFEHHSDEETSSNVQK